ncbi:MAG TPA: hypothetical protein PKY59_19440 [Pyrinomonadaceae bacterium]|nr:hypothetical protein [Pyrinomonadaceae bacterium]
MKKLNIQGIFAASVFKLKRLFVFRFPFSIFHFPLFIFFLFTACQPNAAILNSKPEASSPAASNSAPAISSLEGDIETMRTADFDFIYVFKRKDGAVLTAEDKKYVKDNSPAETNRFLLSEEGKAVVAGSKYMFSPEHLKALTDRFVMENFSKPLAEVNSENTNTNANVKANK